MIIAIDKSRGKSQRRMVRAVLSRYLWRVSPGTYAGGSSGLLERIVTDLGNVEPGEKQKYVLIVLRDASVERGFRYVFVD